jgi:hypothetical protein
MSALTLIANIKQIKKQNGIYYVRESQSADVK